MKIGCLFVGYNTEEYIHESIAPWIAAREDKLGDNTFIISAVSVPFEEYKNESFKDKTQDILRDYYNDFKIDHLITEPEYIKEHLARDKALQYLLFQGVDVICLWDADEVATEFQLIELFEKVNLDRWISWFNIPYKNFAFDKETYLEEPFCPPRIFRVNTNGYKLHRCFWDNDFSYINSEGKEISYKDLASKIIKINPINHYSWIGETAKRKILYQTKHFGHCGYKWNEEKNCLEFNDEYYKKIEKPTPKIMKI